MAAALVCLCVMTRVCACAAGADGQPTPQYAAYGATKAGIAHLMGSVAAECRENGVRVGVHTLSPGMVLTDLILDGATNQNKQAWAHLLLRMHSHVHVCQCISNKPLQLYPMYRVLLTFLFSTKFTLLY
jgi:NAD(P)-dependent dehydrogenase (short-subunit alcohol dehydrogenase family)